MVFLFVQMCECICMCIHISTLSIFFNVSSSYCFVNKVSHYTCHSLRLCWLANDFPRFFCLHLPRNEITGAALPCTLLLHRCCGWNWGIQAWVAGVLLLNYFANSQVSNILIVLVGFKKHTLKLSWFIFVI